jgi:hypothetical protein
MDSAREPQRCTSATKCHAATVSGNTPLQVLRPVANWPGNTDTIFSLAYDAPRNRIITGAKDSQVCSQHEDKGRACCCESEMHCGSTHHTAAIILILRHYKRGSLRQVLVFDEVGQRVGAPQAVSGCFVCSLDIHAASDLLLVGGERLLPSSDLWNSHIEPQTSPQIPMHTTLRCVWGTTGMHRSQHCSAWLLDVSCPS